MSISQVCSNQPEPSDPGHTVKSAVENHTEQNFKRPSSIHRCRSYCFSFYPPNSEETDVRLCDTLVRGDGGWHTGSGWPLFALGISRCSDKHFRNVPPSDPLAPAQLPCCAVIGSCGGQLSLDTAFAIYSPFAVAYNCHPLSARPWDRHADSIHAHDPRWASVTVKTTLPSQHNGRQSGRGGPGSWETVMTDRWEMLVRFSADSCFSAKLFVWGE